MDGQVGEILRALEESGQGGEHARPFQLRAGVAVPRLNKWTNWDTGVHTALVARWPGEVEAGKRTRALVQYADVLPTLVELGGGDPGEMRFDGQSFAAVLRGERDGHRDFVYGVHNNLPEGPSYPVRSVGDGEFRYLRNLKPDEIYIEKHLMGWTGKGQLNNPYWSTWVRDSAYSQRSYGLVKRYMRRPAEQLYHTAEDPYEMSNLAGSAAVAERQERLSAELDRWMEEQGDPGVAQDTEEALQAARKGKHLYGPGKGR